MLKRALVRRHRHGFHLQKFALVDRGKFRNSRHPEARAAICANRAYLALHPEWAH